MKFSTKHFPWILAAAILIMFAAPAIMSQTPHEVVLTWNADPTATGGFQVLRGTVAGTLVQIGTTAVGVNTYTDLTGVAGTQYFYEVDGIDTATPPDVSSPSNEVGPLTFLGNPLSPSGLVGVAK